MVQFLIYILNTSQKMILMIQTLSPQQAVVVQTRLSICDYPLS